MKLKQLSLSEIRPNPFQPREQFDEGKLQELASNIKKHGLIEPIVVTPKGKKFMIVAGERRWRASKLAKQKKIYSIVKTYKSEADIKRDSLVENELREDLSYEEFKAFTFGLAKTLGKPYWNKGYVNGTMLAQYIVGVSGDRMRSRSANTLRNKINDTYRIEIKASAKVKKLVKNGNLDRSTAARIANIEDRKVQNELAEMAKRKTRNEIRDEVSR